MEEGSKNLIPLAIVVAGAMVAGAIYFGGGSGGTALDNRPNGTKDLDAIEIPKVTERDHIRGDRNAPIVVIEYSDLECPFCKVFHNTMKEVIGSYDGKVAWVYRHFPIAQLHSRAAKEAEATECAAELGGNASFWTFTDAIFEVTKSNDSLDPLELPKIAQAVGLDVASFNNCLSSGRYTEFINESIKEAIRTGAQGTPYSVIMVDGNAKGVINGAEPLSSVKAKIDSLLK